MMGIAFTTRSASILTLDINWWERRDLSIAGGAEFTQQDADAASKVAVLGKTPLDHLLGGGMVEYNSDPAWKFVNE